MKISESQEFRNLLKGYKAFRESAAGQALFAELKLRQNILGSEIQLPDKPVSAKINKAVPELGDHFVFYTTHCPRCRATNHHTTPDHPDYISNLVGMRTKCRCGQVYYILDHISDQSPVAMNTPEEPENSFTISLTRHKDPVCGAIGQYTLRRRSPEKPHKHSLWHYLWFPAALLAAVILSLIIRAILLTL